MHDAQGHSCYKVPCAASAPSSSSRSRSSRAAVLPPSTRRTSPRSTRPAPDAASELTSEDGWLSLVAREFLAPGENVVGSDPSATLVLEAPGIPARACAFDLRPDGTVVLRAGAGAPVAVNGAPPTAAPLVPKATGSGTTS